jgi:hypothetical protein
MTPHLPIASRLNLPPPAARPVSRITFVIWDPQADGVAVKHDGVTVWTEQSFDRLDQYLRHVAPLGQQVTIDIEAD